MLLIKYKSDHIYNCNIWYAYESDPVCYYRIDERWNDRYEQVAEGLIVIVDKT